MKNTRNITENIVWVGGSDRRLALFENMFPLTQGVSYNSYVILDEKTCLMDTVDQAISDLFIDNVVATLAGRDLDYLVINHMEPDHCGNIVNIARLYPNMKIIGNSKTFNFLEQFYEDNLTDRYIVVKDLEEISLGKHTLRFYLAPFVHWPEVMVTYELSQNILFSADAFGTFNAMNGNLFVDEVDYWHEWLAETRRYYFNIVGKHGQHVLKLFDKLNGLGIQMIAPLHGPIFRNSDDVARILQTYQTWASYQPEEKGLVIAYASMYGNTEQALQIIASKLAEKGIKNIKMYDISNTDFSYIIADLHRYSHAIFGIVNYNSDLYPKMKAFLDELVATGYQNRDYAMVTNMTWGGKAQKVANDILATGKDLVEINKPLTLKSALKPEQENLVDDFVAAIIEKYQA